MNTILGTPPLVLTKSHNILVVDDTQDNLDLMVDVLEGGPWTVATAGNADVALSVASQTAFDLFLLDVHMPDMDGLELCQRLRCDENTRHTPVIFVTAERTSTKSLIEGLDSGGFDYIVKPFDRAELLARVRVMLRLREAERSYLVVQGALTEQNQQLSTLNDRLADAYQQMLQQRVNLMHKTHDLERANRVKSEFLAKMSHELRTPMNSIIGFTDLMNSDEKDPPTARQAKRLEKIGRNGRQLLALINDILDLSKIEADRLTLDVAPVDLPMVLNECIELARPLIGDKPVVFETRIPSTLNTWMGDEVRLRQIVTNLLSNAAKFTDRGRIILDAAGKDDGFSLAISDTGVGIAPEHLSYVFDAFRQVDSSSTRRAGGTGLGLAICRRLCGLMGGEISAKSTLGEGSTFEFTLPWRLEQCDMDYTDSGYYGLPETARLMFLCSDDLGMVDLADTHLSRQGIEVRHLDASNCDTNMARRECPHGILIDVRSPSAAAVLRMAADVSVPLIWLTKWTDDHQIGCLFQLDGFTCGLDDQDALARAMGGSPPDRQVVLVVAGGEKARKQICNALDGLGCQRVRVACNGPEAISELASGKVETVIVHLADRSTDLFELIERVRRVPEWSSVHIVGVVSDAENEDAMKRGPSDEFVRRHGILTPTLLVDVAEQLMAEPHVEAIGVTR